MTKVQYLQYSTHCTNTIIIVVGKQTNKQTEIKLMSVFKLVQCIMGQRLCCVWFVCCFVLNST